MCPEPVPNGMFAATWEAVALLAATYVVLNVTLSFAAISKFVPLMVTATPSVPMLGVNPLTVGAPESARTVKFALLEMDPDGVVTVIGPVVAVSGTAVLICVTVA